MKRVRVERKKKDRRGREENEDWLSKEGCRGTGSCWKDQQWGAVHHLYTLCILTIILPNIDIDIDRQRQGADSRPSRQGVDSRPSRQGVDSRPSCQGVDSRPCKFGAR